MFFKRFARFKPLLLAPIFIYILCACAGEDRPFQDQPQLKGSEQCLSGVDQDFSAFLEGKSTSDDVDEFWACVSDAILQFEKLTRGREESLYRGEELANFLHEFFLGEKRLSPPLVSEFMEIKKLLIGGSANFLSREELLKAPLLFSRLRDLTQKINPHILVLRQIVIGKSVVPESQFVAAMQASKQVIFGLSDLFVENSGSYSFENLERFLQELGILVDAKSDEQLAKVKLSKYVPLFREAKFLLIGGDRMGIRFQEWPELARVFSGIFDSWSRVSLYVSKENWTSNLALGAIEISLDQILSLLKTAMKNKSSDQIHFEELRPILVELEGLKLLPLDLTATQSRDILEVLVHRALGVRIDGTRIPKSQGLLAVHMDHLMTEFNIWKDSQIYVNSLKDGVLPSPNGEIEEEFHRIATGPWPLNIDQTGRLVFSKGQAAAAEVLSSLTALNWQKTLIRVFVRGFSEDLGRRLSLKGLSKNELKQLAIELEPLGAAFGLYDKNNLDIYKRIFQEANLFMPRSNGDAWLDYAEGVEYLSFVLSGLNAGEFIFADLLKVCPSIEIKGKPHVDVNCFRRRSLERENFVEHLPGVAKLMSANPNLWIEMTKLLESTVRDAPEFGRPIPESDLSLMWVLLQYIETYYLKYDSNQNDLISLAESRTAFDNVYKAILVDLLDGIVENEEDVLTFYTYLFKFGDTPFSQNRMGRSVRFLNWKYHPEKWSYEVNRLRLVEILSALSKL